MLKMQVIISLHLSARLFTSCFALANVPKFKMDVLIKKEQKKGKRFAFAFVKGKRFIWV
jgi:hypothetical protein